MREVWTLQGLSCYVADFLKIDRDLQCSSRKSLRCRMTNQFEVQMMYTCLFQHVRKNYFSLETSRISLKVLNMWLSSSWRSFTEEIEACLVTIEFIKLTILDYQSQWLFSLTDMSAYDQMRSLLRLHQYCWDDIVASHLEHLLFNISFKLWKVWQNV